jgi:hypothetical protein
VTTRQFLAVAVAADGVVVDLSQSVDEDGSTYFPVVRFVAPDGQVVRFESGIGSNPPDYRVGDPVRVLYDPSNPRTARLDTWDNREIEAAMASGSTPVVFVHGLWLLPSSWDNWGPSSRRPVMRRRRRTGRTIPKQLKRLGRTRRSLQRRHSSRLRSDTHRHEHRR